MQHLISLVAKQVNDNGLVVWYDLEGGIGVRPRVRRESSLALASESLDAKGSPNKGHRSNLLF